MSRPQKIPHPRIHQNPIPEIPWLKIHDSARPCISRLTSFFGAATFNCGISLVGLSSADSWHHRTIQPPRKPSSVLALVCDKENTFTFSSMIKHRLTFQNDRGQYDIEDTKNWRQDNSTQGNNFVDCPSLTPRNALLTQYKVSHNTKNSILCILTV